MKFEVTREMVERMDLGDDDVENIGLIRDILLDIRDLLTPQPAKVEEFDRAKYPKNLGSGTVEFCTDKAALCNFDRADLCTLFVPFSRMPPGMREACEAEKPFDEFFVGEWIYERLLEGAKEKALHPQTVSDQLDDVDDIPY